jgi:hypothetical protein
LDGGWFNGGWFNGRYALRFFFDQDGSNLRVRFPAGVVFWDRGELRVRYLNGRDEALYGAVYPDGAAD